MQKDLPECEICRWGGEEFLIIGKGHDIDIAYKILDTFRKSIEAFTFSKDGTDVKLTITIGLASFAPDLSMTEWINVADKKLYAGKYGGKNQVVL